METDALSKRLFSHGANIMADSKHCKGTKLRTILGSLAVLFIAGCVITVSVILVVLVTQGFFVADPDPPGPVIQMSIWDWNKAITPSMGGDPYRLKNQTLEVQGELISKSKENFVLVHDQDHPGMMVNCGYAPSKANKEKLRGLSLGQKITVRGVVRIDADMTLVGAKIVAVDPDKLRN
jgi:hypothetical protein